MNVSEWLVRTARRSPEAPALLSGERVVATYAEFAERAARIGATLRSGHGIRPGDRVALFMKNAPDYLELLYGIWFCGAVAVPVNAKLHVREAAFILANSGSRMVFVSGGEAELAAVLESECLIVDTHDGPLADAFIAPLASPEPRAGTDLAWLFYTSGTTGKPKGVMLSFANLQAMTYAYFVDVDDVLAEDAAVYAAPISHGAGLYNFMHVLRGSRHVVPESGGFDAAELCDLAPRLKSVTMFAAPTMISRLLSFARQSGYRGDGIRTIVYGGGPMYLSDIQTATDQFGDRFVQIYGQGECPMALSALPRGAIVDRSHPAWKERLGSVGTAQSCVRIRIVDPEGNDRAAGEIGEIIAEGSPVMAGYWDNPQATATTLRDGWLWTGDMGSLDADGYLTLRDRSKDVIISGGTNIYPREVEDALLSHPGVTEVSVVGRPNPEWGEEVVAFVVLTEPGSVSEAELDAHCRAHIAGFKRPRTYRFEEALPKNNYGKILKTELRQKLHSD
ncbi:long-chain acyl-CoA synthetase [Hoeflea marina]|uniref:3-methylmercaptopropionyl-CoA ligase n=1 Tax=Hoeflea marina TaxID=274592 RepID=A0A317PEK8_9HYPH|nr:AMP-binding protein [Hoeflea marina]PWV95763.1 long-chain acyl-CoA synthetase [Hoeflea marina]